MEEICPLCQNESKKPNVPKCIICEARKKQASIKNQMKKHLASLTDEERKSFWVQINDEFTERYARELVDSFQRDYENLWKDVRDD